MSAIEFPVDYDESYVAFIGVLGFSALTQQNTRESRVKIQKYIELTAALVRSFKAGRFSVIFVSDSLILSVRESEMGDLVPLCELVGSIQRSLLDHLGFLSRGAISMGPAFVKSNEFQFFGPAIVRAVELEKQSAIYPRVILDPMILKGTTRTRLVQTTRTSDKNKSPLLMSAQTQDFRGKFLNSDHFLFVDYLAECCRKLNRDFMNHLYSIIQDGLSGNVKNIIKYQWMKDYVIACLTMHIDRDDKSGFYDDFSNRFGEL